MNVPIVHLDLRLTVRDFNIIIAEIPGGFYVFASQNHNRDMAVI